MFNTLSGKNQKNVSIPQSQPVPGRENQMRKSESGGYVFKIDDWEKLDRFLILGSEKGYYATAQEMTEQATDAVKACIKEDGKRAVETIVDISESGRAVKNDPALYALALAASAEDEKTRQLALEALPKVARTGTHLFHFLAFVNKSRKWSRMLRTAVSKWYISKSSDSLAYQLVKYRQRDGWTHKDTLCLAHPKPATSNQDAIFSWVVTGDKNKPGLPKTIEDFIRLQKAKNTQDVLTVLAGNPKMPWEAIPPELIKDPLIWEALLPNMPQTALIRNLNRMTSYGLLTNTSQATKLVLSRLADKDWLKSGKVHPFSLFVAQRVYRVGAGIKGKITWSPVGKIIDALEDAFYLTFENVSPVNKPILLAVDVSGSMSSGTIAALPGICPRDAAAAMALITVNTEPDYELIGFDNQIWKNPGITPKTRLNDAIQKLNISASGTDCSLPISYALKSSTNFDGLVMYTDNQSWAGNKHTFQAVNEYRARKNNDFRVVAGAMVGYDASILDPDDSMSLNVVGMDTAAPGIIADFLADRLKNGSNQTDQDTE